MIRETVFGLIGGLGLFLFALGLMSEGLKGIAGRQLRDLLESMAEKAIVAFSIGTGANTLVQSGLAVTSPAIGFVNTGLLVSKQAVCVVINTDIGTASAGIVSTFGRYVITASVCARLSWAAARTV